MAKINKSLSEKTDKNTGKAEIMLRFVGGRLLTLRARSGLHVPPERWNAKTGEIRLSTLKTPLQKELIQTQRKLTELCTLILEQFAGTPKEEITKEWLAGIVDRYHFPEKYQAEEDPDRPVTLFEYVADFIVKAPFRKDKQTGRLLSKNATIVYKTMFMHLRGFARSQHKKDYDFEQVDMKFYNAFVSYLQSKGYTANTVGKIIKELKTVLRQAERDNVNHSNAYKDFTVFAEEVDNIYLTEDELQRIKTANLCHSPAEIQKLVDAQKVNFHIATEKETSQWRICENTLCKVRDWFLLLAWTGSRFSDLEKITQQDINSGYISFRQQKTNNKVVIPIHPVVREIFGKYGYALPEPISNQKFNNYLKIVCMLAGLDSSETITRTEGGVRTSITRPKWMLVSSHTGRRSFCTNMYKRSLPTLTIMAISGHESEKLFLRYIKVSNEEHAHLMMDQWRKFYNV